jgi:gluconolactonase
MSAAAPPAGSSGDRPAIERLDPELDRVVAPDTKIEILAEGFEWSEGPVWVKSTGYLLFSDVPRNVIMRWEEGGGAHEWLRPSGYTGREPRGGEMGSNGLAIDPEGRLAICQHGDRRMARLEAPLSAPAPKFSTLADSWEGARFNSPNDAVFHPNGDLYFTDPPYGLVKQAEDPARELSYQGVFRRRRSGAVDCLVRDMTLPNGLAFSPDLKTLYVSQSDPAAPLWRAFEVHPDGSLGASRILFDASALAKSRSGLPDGLKVETGGNLFATGPGGVLILRPDGRHLGTILTGQRTGNCAFGDDGRTLYITAHMYLMRVRLTAKGAGF